MELVDLVSENWLKPQRTRNWPLPDFEPPNYWLLPHCCNTREVEVDDEAAVPVKYLVCCWMTGSQIQIGLQWSWGNWAKNWRLWRNLKRT